MEGESNQDPGTSSIPKPVIPPPSIPTPGTPPPPPISTGPSQTPAPAANPGAAVNVKIRKEGEELVIPGVTAVPFNTRAIAVVIDSLVAFGIMLTLKLILPGQMFSSLISWAAYLGYWLTRDSLPFLNGQSIGKKAMKIRAVTLDGRSLSGNWEAGAIRNAPLCIPIFGLVELIVLLTRENTADRGRRLGDEWGKTKVIAEVPKTEGEDEAELSA